MKIQVDVSTNKVITQMMGALSPDGRKDLRGAGAESLAHMIQTHIRRYVFQKHFTAHRLNAQPTGHYEKGANDIHTEVTADSAAVVIPIPGISRAFHDVEIVADRAKALTLPIHEISYGRRVAEVKALGWKIFPALNKNNVDLLMGKQGTDVKALYVLKPSVRQKRDPSLLPTAEEMRKNVGRAMLGRIKSIIEKSRSQAS